ncbi:MAG: bifunctional oligoribonuclease/PAP phosphatase NrnA, partial [Treponema sp.]|nr:bifunctional oligoribonuclease/PAP phosphatase NrnA [Treponema sp.]
MKEQDLYTSGPEAPAELLEFITAGRKFLVAGHKEPDGDCVGSQLSLVSLLRRLGKEAIPCSAGPFKRPEIKVYESLFIPAPDENQRGDARVIITDCASPDRTGDLAPFLKGLKTAVIDHHGTGPHDVPEGGPLFLDGKAPSATFLVQKVFDGLGMEPTPEEAKLLLFGLCTDTGFFRHTDTAGAATFEAAARLIRAGASPKETFAAINGGKSLESRILMGRVLARTESYFGGRLLLSTEEYEEIRRFGVEGRDSDSFYMLLQAVAGVEAIVIIRQENPGRCTVGFRSRDRIDVAAIAAAFGGGGHKNAAGLSAPGTAAEL